MQGFFDPALLNDLEARLGGIRRVRARGLRRLCLFVPEHHALTGLARVNGEDALYWHDHVHGLAVKARAEADGCIAQGQFVDRGMTDVQNDLALSTIHWYIARMR